MTREQQPVLERARFALVRIADDDALLRRLPATAFPLHPGREARSAAPEQPGVLDLLEHGLGSGGATVGACERRTDRLAGLQRVGQHRSGAPDLLLDAEQSCGPRIERRAREDQVTDRVDAGGVEPRNRPLVDQQRRCLVAEAEEGRAFHTDEAVFRGLAGLGPQAFAHALQQFGRAAHAVRDVVGKQDVVDAAWFRGEEVVETRDAAHPGDGQAEAGRDAVQRRGRHVVVTLLDFPQDLQQVRRRAPPACHCRVDAGFDAGSIRLYVVHSAGASVVA